MPEDFSHLSEHVTQELIGGFLLSYFRSVRTESDVELARDFHPEKTESGTIQRVDFAILERSTGRPLAIFEMATKKANLEQKAKLLSRSRALVPQEQHPKIMAGLVVPNSISKDADVSTCAKKHGLQLVTYPG